MKESSESCSVLIIGQRKIFANCCHRTAGVPSGKQREFLASRDANLN